MARPVKSQTLRALHGTARADRRPRQEVAARLLTPPRPPRHLSKAVAAEWRRVMAVLVKLGAVTGGDLFMVELLCATLATARQAEATLAVEGYTTGTAADGVKSHPAARVLATARAQAARLLGELGLSPRGRQMLDIQPALASEPDRLSLKEFLATNPAHRSP